MNYEYDAWSKLLGITGNGGTALTEGSLADTISKLNPFRYRSYVYDDETGLYYLKSRYYDPQTGRFVNADGVINSGHNFIGYNMFVYCNNNPIDSFDPNGDKEYPAGFIGPLRPGDTIISLPAPKPSSSGSSKPTPPPKPPKPGYDPTPPAENFVKNSVISMVDTLAGAAIAKIPTVAKKTIPVKILGSAFTMDCYTELASVKALKGVSATLGVATVATYAWDISNDYQNYGGFTEDFAKAATIDTAATATCFLVGMACTGAGAPVALGLAITIGVGVFVTWLSDETKKAWIGY